MMKQAAYQFATEIDVLLSEGYRIWEDFGFPVPDQEEKHKIAYCAVDSCENGKFAKEYAAACQCFYLFRKLHCMTECEPEKATLLGDYFFSRFSHYLIPIDSTRLIDLFSEYLKKDVKDVVKSSADFCTDAYMDFIRSTAKEIGL